MIRKTGPHPAEIARFSALQAIANQRLATIVKKIEAKSTFSICQLADAARNPAAKWWRSVATGESPWCRTPNDDAKP